ncbi:unnamed protein product [Parnassius apollo]|uniref:(apollo) hypothetical protein n=1 Tax=Parnassius apollo TaxID=110799 RepID=A0A8S3XZQ2_PARAO|nr:unnamed protein product [Parnassius apollo]
MYKRIIFKRLGISRSSGSSETKSNAPNMKMMIVAVLALVAVASAAVANVRPEGERVYVVPPQTLRSESSQQPDGNYVYSFETENGINRGERGNLKEVLDEEDKPKNVIVVEGSYSYTNPDGKVETVNYVADENGYRAEGDSIPKVAPTRR